MHSVGRDKVELRPITHVSTSASIEAISKIFEQKFDAGEPEEAEEVICGALVTDDQAAEVAEVGKQPFDLPTAFVAPELSTILSFGLFAVFPVWRDQFDALFSQFGV
jgi:hypothetical protein